MLIIGHHILYMLPVGRIIENCKLSDHRYADDIQIYFEWTEDETSSMLLRVYT